MDCRFYPSTQWEMYKRLKNEPQSEEKKMRVKITASRTGTLLQDLKWGTPFRLIADNSIYFVNLHDNIERTKWMGISCLLVSETGLSSTHMAGNTLVIPLSLTNIEATEL